MATIAQQLTELVNQKNALAANLTTKGVTANSSETLNTLVPKVLDIQTGGTNKLPQVVDKTVTTITADDLAGVTEIGVYAFCLCSSLTSITIPEGVTSIGDWAFRDCSSLSSITLPGTLTSIGNNAFINCSNLTSITIPESVTSISLGAFQSCSSLTSMRVEATTPPTLSRTSAISSATTQIQVPMASVEAYKTATNWSNFADIIVGYEEETT